MNKFLIPVITSIFILGTLGISQDAFAVAPVISSYVADDPNDLDAIWSNGDTITINLDVTGNVTIGAITDNTDITGNFTFPLQDPLNGATFTGEWITKKQLVITVSSIGGNTPLIGTSTVDPKSTNNISTTVNDTSVMLTSTADVVLSGDFGLFVALISNGGSGCDDCEAPTLGVDKRGTQLVSNGFTYNGHSIDVERFFTPYPLVTAQVGKQNVAEFKIYENEGTDNIQHFELAFGLAKGESIGMSKAVINWDKSFDGIETVTLNDPENVLDKIKVTTSEGYCSDEMQTKCLIVKVTHTFRAPLDFDILGTNVWDAKRNAWQNYYNHGIEVVGESLNPAKEYDGINKGHIYHLTETSKTSAVDEFGNSWSLKYDKWEMDYVMPEKIQDTSSIMTRTHSDFIEYKEIQANNAIEELLVLCPTCLMPYADFEDSTMLEYSERIDRENDLELQQNIAFEFERAQIIMNNILNSYK
jgi:hypothetical protein